MVKAIPIQDQGFEVEGIPILPIRVMHHKLPVFGYRISNFTYITDANYIPEEELGKIAGTEVLVINALQNSRHISHFNLEQALEMIQRIQPKRAYLTHISHKLGLHREVDLQPPFLDGDWILREFGSVSIGVERPLTGRVEAVRGPVPFPET